MSHPKWWRSVRFRATAAAMVVVGVALALGAIGFTATLNLALASATSSAAEMAVEEIADRAEDSGPGIVADLDDDMVVQVIDSSGEIVAQTEEAYGLDLSQMSEIVEIDDDRYLVVHETVDDVGLVVWLGHPLGDDGATVNVVVQLLIVTIPLLVALVGTITWLVTGRALAPVHRIRSEVEEITVSALDRRVVVPETDDEISALAATMNRMLEGLERGARTQRQFVSDASHELRSPLTTIRQHAELARTHPDLLDGVELSDVVLAEGLRMQELVDSLLLLARLDEGASTRWKAIDLDDLALAEAARARAGDAIVDGTRIGAARVLGDERLLSRVARNLVDNALRHAVSRVAITVTIDEGQAVFSVEDDGSGVPESDRERIFERFVRLDEARAREEGGTGLGLAIVRSIVTAHGGSVTVDESRWQGARFTVKLPILAHSDVAS